MVASPLTHERFLSRTRGTYGPPLFASDGSTIPYAKTPVDGLLHCGDSTFPGIGFSMELSRFAFLPKHASTRSSQRSRT